MTQPKFRSTAPSAYFRAYSNATKASSTAASNSIWKRSIRAFSNISLDFERNAQRTRRSGLPLCFALVCFALLCFYPEFGGFENPLCFALLCFGFFELSEKSTLLCFAFASSDILQILGIYRHFEEIFRFFR